MTEAERAEELAFAYCLRSLAAAERTEHELFTRLAGRGYADEVAEAVLGRLQRAGYVDDARFARMWVESRSRTRSLAAPVLRQELRRKGVDDELIDSALEQLDRDGEDERARALLARRMPAELPVDRAERDRLKRRLGGQLARKGYSGSRVWTLIDEAMSG